LDGARDRARRDARDAAEQLNKLRAVLPDRAEVDRQLHEAEEAAAGGEIEARAALERSELARETWDAAAASHRQLLGLAQDYDRLVSEGRALRAQRDASVERLRELTAEMEALAGAEARLAELEPLASDLPGMEQRLRLTEAVAAAAEALLANPAPSPVEPPEPSVERAQAARALAEAARAEHAGIEGRLAAARSTLELSREAHERSAALSGSEDCPLCGRALDAAFEQVQEHRALELAAAEAAV